MSVYMRRLMPSSLGCGPFGGRGQTGAAFTLREERSLVVEVCVISDVDSRAGIVVDWFGVVKRVGGDRDAVGASDALYERTGIVSDVVDRGGSDRNVKASDILYAEEWYGVNGKSKDGKSVKL